mgnify:CR=1 FL=1
MYKLSVGAEQLTNKERYRQTLRQDSLNSRLLKNMKIIQPEK